MQTPPSKCLCQWEGQWLKFSDLGQLFYLRSFAKALLRSLKCWICLFSTKVFSLFMVIAYDSVWIGNYEIEVYGSLLWIYEYHIEWNMANGTFDWNFSLLFKWGCVSYTWRVKDWVGHSLRKIQICCFQWYFSHSSNLGLPPRGSWEYCYKSIGNFLRQKFYHLQVPASTTESDKPWKSQEAIFASIVG